MLQIFSSLFPVLAKGGKYHSYHLSLSFFNSTWFVLEFYHGFSSVSDQILLWDLVYNSPLVCLLLGLSVVVELMIYSAENHLAPYHDIMLLYKILFKLKALPEHGCSVKAELVQGRSLPLAIALSALLIFWSAALREAAKLQCHAL